jgi:serine phosphatase RsbU (regulator of sigma subunit)
MSGPKIVLKSIAYHSEVCWDRTGSYVNNATNFIPTDDLYLLAILNSSFMWWIMTRVLPHKKDESLAMDGTRIDKLPIADAPSALKVEVAESVQKLMDAWRTLQQSEGDLAFEGLSRIRRAERDVNALVLKAYGISEAEAAIVRDTPALRDPLVVLDKRPEAFFRSGDAAEE